MTRKDFEAIAGAIRSAAIPGWDKSNDMAEAAYGQGVNDVARALADVLENSNPNFDYQRFMSACGVN